MSKDFKYYKLTPFKWFILENFPFIEADFDALTNYELFCKIGKEMNKIIEATNLSGEQVEALTEFINNFFDNLDLQDEVNNKLDEMAQDGTLAEIINTEIFDDLQNQINSINEELQNQDTIFLGDSYAAGTTYEHGSVEFLTSWCEELRRQMGLTTGHYYIFAQGNAGFAKIGNNSMNFQMTLASRINEITDRNKIKNIIVCAGYNDWNEEASLIHQRIGEFIRYCKQQFPNAQVYLGMIAGNSADTQQGALVRERLITRVLNAYTRCTDFGGLYLSGTELFGHNFFMFNEQGNHPNELGYIRVGRMIYNALKQGKAEQVEPLVAIELDSIYGDNYKVKFQSSMQNYSKIIYMDNYSITNQTINTQGINVVKIVDANTTNKLFKSTISSKSIQIPCDIYVLDTSNNDYFAPRKNYS